MRRTRRIVVVCMMMIVGLKDLLGSVFRFSMCGHGENPNIQG